MDIETTGGHAAGCGITEIAILIHDGNDIVERFETLINPRCPIPLHIQALTGITDEMVADSPVFEEIAPRIYELLQGPIFVAHNVNFDYSFIKYHLEAAGYPFASPKLCTVRLSRKIRPGQPSYSLGRLCDALGIPIPHRHRAGGDAAATAILFSRLLAWDNEDVIGEMLKNTSGHQQLPPHLPKEQFDALPHCAGVYYFRDHSDKVIYVGKARNIRSRVAQHFSGNNPNAQRQHFMRYIHGITYERCGTELMALLLEAAEIRRLWPVYNRALKRFEPKYALYAYEDRGGYLRLAIGKHGRDHQHIHLFHRSGDAIGLLQQLIREFNLHPGLCVFGIGYRGTGYTSYPPSSANGATRVEVSPDIHNGRVRRALDFLARNSPTFAIFDRGRDNDETSCIWVENGELYGMGHISKYADMVSPEQLKETLTPYGSNHYMMQLIHDYAAKHPLKIWKPGQQIPQPLD